MESTILILLCWTIVYVESQHSIPVTVQQMKSLESELNQLKTKVPKIETKLRAELLTVASLIDNRVREVLAGILKERSLEDMVSEINHLKMNDNMLKRQQQHMSREISQLRKERTLGEMRHAIKVPARNSENLELIIDDLLDGLNDTKDKVTELSEDHSSLKTKHNELESSAEKAWMRIETVENKTNLLRSDVKALNQEIRKVQVDASNNSEEVQGIFERVNQQNDQMENKADILNRDVTHLTKLMTKVRKKTSKNSNLLQRIADRLKQQTEQVQILLKRDNETSKQFDLNEDRLKIFQNDLKFLKEQHASDYIGSSTPVPLSTTPTSGETVRSRLLISDYRVRNTISRQLKLDGNQISTYPYLTATHINAITYDPTSNAIVYSRSYPAGIYSTRLNVNYTSTLRANIMSYGLAIDEGRQLLFLTTYNPNKTVSKMSTDGKNFIAITDLYEYGNNPTGIALDTRNRMIYVSNRNKLFSLTYEGRSIQILNSRGDIYGVALDEGRGLLYFNEWKQIMRRPLSGGRSVLVREVDFYTRNMEYYNNTVYISSQLNGNTYALYTNFNNGVLKKLTTKTRRSVICLIP